MDSQQLVAHRRNRCTNALRAAGAINHLSIGALGLEELANIFDISLLCYEFIPQLQECCVMNLWPTTEPLEVRLQAISNLREKSKCLATHLGNVGNQDPSDVTSFAATMPVL